MKSKAVNLNKESYDIYIGRAPFGQKRNPLANPYTIHTGEYSRERAVHLFAYDFKTNWKTEPDFRESVISCKGKKLGCFCKPKLCHGDVIALFINTYELKGEKEALKEIESFLLD